MNRITGPAQRGGPGAGQVAAGTPQAGEAMAALIEVVRSGPARRRGSAAEGLGAFGPAAVSAVPALIGLLKEAGSAREPTTAGNAAARAGQDRPRHPGGRRGPRRPDRGPRRARDVDPRGAVYALSAFGPKAAAAVPAIRALEEKDPDPRVRREATAALEKIKPQSK